MNTPAARGISLCCILLLFLVQPALWSEPLKPPAKWDQQVLRSLPAEADQGMTGLPAHLRVRAAAEYSFGTAVSSDGTVYFTEFKGTLCSLSPRGEVKRRDLKRGGAYGIATDRDGNIFVGFDSDRDDGGIRRISPSGEETMIVNGLTRPRQLACDAAGDVYFLTEGARRISKWNRASGAVETVLDGLKCPQGLAVGSDGSVYYSEYGTFGERGVAVEPGIVYVLRPGGTASKLASGFWRARGLALTPSGEVLVAGEANAWDQGNSGAMFKVSSDGKTQVVAQGLDYPQVPAVGPGGEVYFGECRDNLLLEYDPAVEFTASQWPSQPGIEIGVSGGVWQPGASADGGKPVKLTINDVVLEGTARATTSKRSLSIWVRIPAERLNLSREALPYPSPESHLPGVFRMPSVECPGANGVFVVPARGHERARWPVRHNDAGTELAAEDFSESPTAYLVYVEYCLPQ